MLGWSAPCEGDSVNQALRSAMLAAGLEHLDLASHLSVDPKTVDRWLAGRLPHPRNRAAIAKLVRRAEVELWPSTSATGRHGRRGGEVRAVYPHRWAVPREVWFSLFERARREISILVYSGLFLAEDAGLVRLLGERAETGVSVRILLGDPESSEVLQRGDDEGIGESMGARIRNALKLLRPLVGVEGAQLRLHGTALYNSIYRADD